MIDFHNQWIQLAIFEIIVVVPLLIWAEYLISKKRKSSR